MAKEFDNATLRLKTIIKIKEKISTINKQDCANFERVIKELSNAYCPGTPLKEIFQIANVPENVLRRIRSEEKYNGLKLEGCIRIALAIGVDEIEDIDYLLVTRGFAALSDASNYKTMMYKEIIVVLLDEKELEGEDRVQIFLQETGVISS